MRTQRPPSSDVPGRHRAPLDLDGDGSHAPAEVTAGNREVRPMPLIRAGSARWPRGPSTRGPSRSDVVGRLAGRPTRRSLPLGQDRARSSVVLGDARARWPLRLELIELECLVVFDTLEIAIGEVAVSIVCHGPFLLPARGTNEGRTTRAGVYVIVQDPPSYIRRDYLGLVPYSTDSSSAPRVGASLAPPHPRASAPLLAASPRYA